MLLYILRIHNKNFKCIDFLFLNYILYIVNYVNKQKFLYFMKFLVVFDDDAQIVLGFLPLNDSAGSPYIRGRKICINDSKFSGLKPLKTESRFERLNPRYESGTLIIEVSENVSDFGYSILVTPGPRDTAIERLWKERYQ